MKFLIILMFAIEAVFAITEEFSYIAGDPNGNAKLFFSYF